MESSAFDGLSHERKTSMPAISISIQVITTVLLWIRVASRFTTPSRMGIDDVLIVTAWFLGLGLTIAVLLGTEKFELNRHIWDVQPINWWRGALVGFNVEVLFFWSTCATKVSVLLFYRRLVEGTVSPKFKLAIWAAIAFVVAYTISFQVVVIFTCSPVEAQWRQFDRVYNLNNSFECSSREVQTAIAKLVGALSVVTDFYSVMLPAALVWQIQINRRQKIGLLVIFSIGLLVCGAGAARTYYLGVIFSTSIDKTWHTWNVFLASIIECNVAIIAACAPSLKALFGRYFKDVASRHASKFSGSRSVNSDRKTYGSNSTGSQASRKGHSVKGSISKSELNRLPDRGQELSRFAPTHEHGDVHSEDIAVAYEGSPDRKSSAGTSKLFDQPATSQSAKRATQQSFIISPAASDDDEVSLVAQTEPYRSDASSYTYNEPYPGSNAFRNSKVLSMKSPLTDKFSPSRRQSLPQSEGSLSNDIEQPDPLLPPTTTVASSQDYSERLRSRYAAI